MINQQFYLGDWLVEPNSNTLQLGKTKRTVEPKAMDVLLLLCQQAGDVISADDIVAQCWPESVVGDNPIHKTITQLRKALDDKASAPTYIETIRKRGYRVIASVDFIDDDHSKASQTEWQGKSPFPGLNAFSSEESQIFYGRNAAVGQLLTRLAEQFAKKRPFTLVIGPSGSGKSSLIHAGLLPRLTQEKGANGINALDFLSIDFADHNPNALYHELAAYMLDWDCGELPLFDGYSTDRLATTLIEAPETISAIISKMLSGNTATHAIAYPCYVIVLDRLEAYLANKSISIDDKNRFLTMLEVLCNSGGCAVLLACRNDFYPLLTDYPVLMRNKDRGAHFDLAPPNAAELSQMIRLPCVAGGLVWEQDESSGGSLDDIILTDAANQPDALPLLQYTLQELYLQRSNNTLQITAYKQLGGIEGAIGHKAESIYQHLPASVKDAINTVLPLVLTISNEGKNITGRTALWSELKTKDEKRLVEQMVEERLFVSQLHQNIPSFRVAHEAVLRRWPRVTEWLAQHQSALVTRNRLASQTQQWLNDNKSSAFLLSSGKPLSDAQALELKYQFTLSKDEKRYIRASQRHATQIKWVKRITVSALTMLTVISLGSTYRSYQSEHLAERKRLEAENLMGFMIGDFADKLRSVKRMDLLEGISEQALTYVEQSQQQSDTGLFAPSLPPASFELRFQHALSLQAVAEVRYYRDDEETAKATYEEAEIRLNELLTEQPENFELLKAAGANAFWLGHLNTINVNEEGDALPHLQRYLEYSERMLSLKPTSNIAKLEVAYAKSALGSLFFDRFDFERASANFLESLTLKQEISNEDNSNLEAKLYAINSMSWLASSKLHSGEYESAYKTFKLASKLLGELHNNSSGNANVKENYVAILIQQANLAQFLSFEADYTNSLEKAYDLIADTLSQDPDNSAWIRDKETTASYLLLSNSTLKDDINFEQLYENAEKLNASWIANRILEYLQINNEWLNAEKLIERYSKTIFLPPDKTLTSFNLEKEITMVKWFIIQYVQYSEQNKQALADSVCNSAVMKVKTLINKTKHPDVVLSYQFLKQCNNLDVEMTLDVNSFLAKLSSHYYYQLY